MLFYITASSAGSSLLGLTEKKEINSIEELIEFVKVDAHGAPVIITPPSGFDGNWDTWTLEIYDDYRE